MKRATRSAILLAGLSAAQLGAAQPTQPGDPPTTATLLLQLARDHGLRQRGRQTAADVLHIRTLLRAAVRVDPRLSEAYVWLYELAVLAGDRQEAWSALDALVAADPGHNGAFARWLEAGLARRNTVEQRRAWLEEQLALRAERPGQQSMVCVALAGLAVQQLDRPNAQELVDRALRLDPANPEAVVLRDELLGDDAPPEERVGSALAVLRMNPLDVGAAWRAGALLDEYGFAEDAGRFYEHAVGVHRAPNPGNTVPARYMLTLARNRLALGDDAQALRLTEQAVKVEPAFTEARLFVFWLLNRAERTDEAEATRAALARRFAIVREPDEWPLEDVIQAAWFYATIEPQPQRALMLAEAAAKRAPGEPRVQRVLGWAQAVNFREEEAKRTLMPVAGRDPYAAYALGRLLKDAGDAEAPARLVANLPHTPRSGPAYELLAELGALPAEPEPAQRRYPRIAELLAEFDRQVLEFAGDPGRFLDVAVTTERASLFPAEPWIAVLRITNRGGFPITLGPDWMVNPVFLLSFHVEGDERRDYPYLLTITLDRERVLRPGQTVSETRLIDVGPLRRIARGTPQQLQVVTITTLFDPVQAPSGGWRPSLSGQELRAAYFNRLPADTGRESLRALFAAFRGEGRAGQFRAVEVFGQLLGEQQRAERGRLRYTPEAVPADRLHQALLAGLNSSSWELRVRALDALQLAGLDRQLFRAAESCLHHDHWLVRLAAVRLLARQGRAFAEIAEQIAAADPDELVRDLARSYVMRWRPREPTSAPSAAPTSSAP